MPPTDTRPYESNIASQELGVQSHNCVSPEHPDWNHPRSHPVKGDFETGCGPSPSNPKRYKSGDTLGTQYMYLHVSLFHYEMWHISVKSTNKHTQNELRLCAVSAAPRFSLRRLARLAASVFMISFLFRILERLMEGEALECSDPDSLVSSS